MLGLTPRMRADLASGKDAAGSSKIAKEADIRGVPMFIFDSKLAVSGAQPPEYLAQAIVRAAQVEAAE